MCFRAAAGAQGLWIEQGNDRGVHNVIQCFSYKFLRSSVSLFSQNVSPKFVARCMAVLTGDTLEIFVSNINIKTVDEPNSARVLIGCKSKTYNLLCRAAHPNMHYCASPSCEKLTLLINLEIR